LLANVIYLCVRQAVGMEISVMEFVEMYRKGEPYVSFSWFIISIMYFYVMFYVIFNIFKKNIAVFLMIPGSVLYMYLVKLIGFDYHWYTTAFCFAGGVIWYQYREVLTAAARKQGFLKILLVFAITFALLFATFKNVYFYIAGSNITALCFQIFMMLWLQKVRIHNFVLEFLGKISFEFYILHGIVIKIFNDYIVLHGNWYVLAVMVVSMLMATILFKLDKKVIPWMTGIEYGKKRVTDSE
jgi:peptidoglycan/LPS O-acetylase OafA/YrhL